MDEQTNPNKVEGLHHLAICTSNMKDQIEFFEEKVKDSGNYFNESSLKDWDIQYGLKQYQNL